MPTAGARLKAAMFAAAYDVEKVATELDVSHQIVRTWLRQTTKEAHMSAVHLMSLAHMLNVRGGWLGLGDGYPERFTTAEVTKENLFSLFDSLDLRGKRILINIAIHLARE